VTERNNGSPNAPTGLAAWHTSLSALATTLLLVVAAEHMYLVVPRYRRVLESAGVVLNAPARVAIGISHFGLFFFVVCLLGIAVAYHADRKGRTGLLPAVLALVAVVTAVYLALVSSVYLDLARLMERLQ
jgi:uncharacterized membrane protein